MRRIPTQNVEILNLGEQRLADWCAKRQAEYQDGLALFLSMSYFLDSTGWPVRNLTPDEWKEFFDDAFRRRQNSLSQNQEEEK